MFVPPDRLLTPFMFDAFASDTTHNGDKTPPLCQTDFFSASNQPAPVIIADFPGLEKSIRKKHFNKKA